MTMTAIPACDLPLDPALPGLTESASPERMLDACRASLPAASGERSNLKSQISNPRWTACRITEAIYQPGRSCRVAYALENGEDRFAHPVERDGCGESPDPAASEGCAKRPDIVYALWAADVRPHASAVRVHGPGGGFQLFRYPRDRRLREIRALRRDDWLRRASECWFADWLGGGRFDADDWRWTPIKYVPESRLVCRLKGRWIGQGADRWVRAYIRIGRREDVDRQCDFLRRIEQMLAEAGVGLTVPRALGALPDRRLLATEFIRGRTLREMAREGDFDGVARAVSLIAAVSRLNLPGGLLDIPLISNLKSQIETAVTPPQFQISNLKLLDDLAAATSGNQSQLTILRSWANAVPPPPETPRLIHGDLHAGQVLAKGDRLCLVDWDCCARGDPTQDIANLAAEFDAADAHAISNLKSQIETAQGAALARSCVEAWRRAGGPFNAAAARWWNTRALVLRAWGLLRHLRPAWRRETSRLLRHAVSVHLEGCRWMD